MLDHTPPRSWDDRGRARKWLVGFISDTVDPGSWRISDVENLCDGIFVVTRQGWKTMIVLKEPFADDPDALVEFVEEFLTKRKEQN